MDDIWNDRRVVTIDLLGDEFLDANRSEARYALRLRRIQTLRCWQTGTVRIAALTLALVVGWAGPSPADDLQPASDVAVPEKAPSEEAPGSHVHDSQPAPERSAREILKDIWTRDKPLLVDGNPLEDVKVVGELENLRVIIKDGQVYKNTL
jgi:hypothetical protein